MKNTPYNDSGEEFKELVAWMQRQQEDNNESLEQLRRNLRRARATELTPRQAELLRLHFEEGKSMRQIAREQGIGISSVSRAITRAKNRLRRCLRYSL